MEKDTSTLDFPQAEREQHLVRATPMDLLSVALHNNAAIDVIERLAALQEKSLARDAEIAFNDELSHIESEIKRIAPDMVNQQTKSKWASYAAIDRVIRPLFPKGFSLSFSTEDCPRLDRTRVVGFVSYAGHTRRYQIDIPDDGKGAKGGDVMSATHATGAAISYGRRYLVGAIFNLAIAEDTDGNTNGELAERCEWIANAKDMEELKKLYKQAYDLFEAVPAALKAIIAAKNKRRQELS